MDSRPNHIGLPLAAGSRSVTTSHVHLLHGHDCVWCNPDSRSARPSVSEVITHKSSCCVELQGAVINAGAFT